VPPYRELPSVDGITIHTRGSTFFTRVRANARVTLRRWPLLLLLAATPAAFLVLASFAIRFEDAEVDVHSWIARTLLCGIAFVAGIASLTVVVRSIARPPSERDLPRALTFTADTIVVCDADEVVFDAGWTWLASASASSSEIVLTLRVDPLCLLFVKRELLGPGQFERLRSWLEKHGRLG
jgi:hypothetical protein